MKIIVRSGQYKELEARQIDPKLETDAICLHTPNGHYIAFIGDEAVVYAVGCFEGTGAYKEAVFGYDWVSVAKMDTVRTTDFDGKFYMILFRKHAKARKEP